jgi:RNA polymerase sigma factor (sigma-70 family)
MMPEPEHGFAESVQPISDEPVTDAVSHVREGSRETSIPLEQCAQEGISMTFDGVDLVPVAERVAFAVTCAADGDFGALRFLLSRAQVGDPTAFNFLQGRLHAGYTPVLAFLVRCVRDRNELAFEFLYRNFAPGIRVYLRGRIGNARVAEEITQDTFLQVWKELPRANDETETKFKSWLYTIASHLSADYFRNPKRSQAQTQSLEELTEDGLATIPSTEGPEEYIVERDVIKEALESLPPQQCKALCMEAYVNLPQREKAKRLGVAEGTFSSIVSRGRKAVKRKRKHILSESEVLEGEGPTNG